MADQSKREQIVEYLVEQLKELDDFKTVTRRMPEYAELQNFGTTQFPVLVVSAGLPVPVEHRHGREAGGSDYFISSLTMVVYVFDNLLVDSDTRVSYLADAVWAKVHEEPTKGGLVIATGVTFEPKTMYLRPFISFAVNVVCNYTHTTGAI